MNFGVLILCVIIGLIFGIIVGALWLVIKVILAQKKALKDFENGKAFEIKNSPNEKIEVPKPNKKTNLKKNNKSALSKLFGKKDKGVKK